MLSSYVKKRRKWLASLLKLDTFLFYITCRNSLSFKTGDSCHDELGIKGMCDIENTISKLGNERKAFLTKYNYIDLYPYIFYNRK